MSGPTRWRDDASAPEGARALLGAARGSRPITREARARSAARIDRIVALPAAASIGLWIKGFALAAGIGTAGVVAAPHVLHALRDTRDTHASSAQQADAPPPRGAAIPARGAMSPAPADPESRDNPEHEGDAPALPEAPRERSDALSVRAAGSPLAQHAAPAKIDAPAPRVAEDTRDSLTREAAMLEEARAALATHPADALAKLDAHAAAFPAGQLTMERELLAVDALRRLGRTREARARGEALVARARGSIYEARARHMIEELSSIP